MSDGKRKKMRYEKILFFGIALFMLAACAKSEKPAGEITAPPPGDYIENFNLKRTVNGKVQWELKAKSARFLNKDEAELKDIEVTVFSEKQKNVIVAAGGLVNVNTSDIRTFGPTTLRSPERTIYTSDVKYLTRDNKISTDKSVKIITKDTEIIASSMVSDTNLDSIVLTDQKIVWRSN